MYWNDRAKKFDEQNPMVWELFKHFTFEAIAAGMKKMGGEMIFGRIRWETAVVTKGEPFKINQNFQAYYTRKFMETFPAHNGFFRTRRQRA